MMMVLKYDMHDASSSSLFFVVQVPKYVGGSVGAIGDPSRAPQGFISRTSCPTIQVLFTH